MATLTEDIASITQSLVRARCGGTSPTDDDVQDALDDVLTKLFPRIGLHSHLRQDVLVELRIRMLLPANPF